MTRAIKGNVESICLWCGRQTNAENSNREHIFPRTIGGRKTLPMGAVCNICNHRFGDKIYGAAEKYSLDEALKIEHPVMMRSYQLDPRLGRHDEDRKKREKVDIKGKGEASDVRIIQKIPNEYDINANWSITSETFVRSLHKCTANVICDIYGSITTRKNYGDLIKFVYEGGDVRPWTYAVSFSTLHSGLRKYEPTPLVFFPADGGNKHLVSFVHTSGIWLTGSQPYLLNPVLVESISDTIIKKIQKDNETNPEKAVNSFGADGWGLKSKPIGRLRFYWIVKEIEGTPDDRFLHLLTRCEVCGQTNRTGIVLSREIIPKSIRYDIVTYEKNSWNRYTKEELRRLGLAEEKWSHLTQGLSVPEENDVRKLNIHDCKTICINCGALINYSASDCFV